MSLWRILGFVAAGLAAEELRKATPWGYLLIGGVWVAWNTASALEEERA